MTRKAYIVNAFSLNMLPDINDGEVVEACISKLPTHEARKLIKPPYIEAISYLGHEAIAVRASNDLGLNLPVNRSTLRLDGAESTLVVCQYRGPRLPEGATELPEGAIIEYYYVYLKVTRW